MTRGGQEKSITHPVASDGWPNGKGTKNFHSATPKLGQQIKKAF